MNHKESKQFRKMIESAIENKNLKSVMADEPKGRMESSE